MKKYILILGVLFAIPSRILACTALEFGSPDQGGIAHNVDWSLPAAGAFFVNARGTLKQGELLGGKDPVAHWTSKYGSLTYTITGREFPAGGRNEAGLSVQALMFKGRFPTSVESSLPALGATQWVQYQLDTAATLTDAISNASKIRPVSAAIVHYFICDRTHNCGVFQFVDGQLKIYEGNSLPTPVLTNSAYPDSLRSWMDCKTSKCNITDRSLERFAEAAKARETFTPGNDPIEFASVQLAKVAQTGPITTRYSFVDIQKPGANVLYFTTVARWSRWSSIQVDALDFSCSNAGRFLEITSTLQGNQTASFKPFQSSIQSQLVGQMPISADAKKILIDYPTTKTKCSDRQ